MLLPLLMMVYVSVFRENGFNGDNRLLLSGRTAIDFICQDLPMVEISPRFICRLIVAIP